MPERQLCIHGLSVNSYADHSFIDQCTGTRYNTRQYLPKLALYLVRTYHSLQAKLARYKVSKGYHLVQGKQGKLGYKQVSLLGVQVQVGTGTRQGRVGIIAGKRKEHKDATNNRVSVWCPTSR